MWGDVGSNLYSLKLVNFLEQITPFYKESRNHAGVKDKNLAPIVDTDLPCGPISNLRADQN
jgi:hypothetical protein